MTYKEIASFLKVYVDGDTPIPYGEFLAKAGVDYKAPEETMEYSIGGIHLGFNQETGRLFVHSTYGMNAMGRALGYKDGDEFVSINNRDVPSTGLQQYINETLASLQEGEQLDITVIRKDDNGEGQEVVLSAPVQKVKRLSAPELSPSENPSAEALALRQAWLGVGS